MTLAIFQRLSRPRLISTYCSPRIKLAEWNELVERTLSDATTLPPTQESCRTRTFMERDLLEQVP